MTAQNQSFRPRPGGGFNQGLGQFGEALDESAMAQAGTQKSLTQQSVSPTTAPPPGPKTGAGGQAGPAPAPRPVGTLGQELIQRPARDIWQEIRQFFSLNTWLGIKPDTDDPQKKAKMAATHKRFNGLTEDQQAVAKKLYQEKMQKQKQEEEEKQRRKQLEEKKKAESLVMPSSPKKGPIGPASGKSNKANTTEMLNQQRKMLSNPNQGF